MAVRSLPGFQPLGPAEQSLVDLLDSGGFDRLGDGGVPDDGDASRAVRAELIRFLILGGEEAPRLHEKGLRLSGAWVTGSLDLEGCRIPRDIGLADCRFEAAPVLRSAIIDTLFLDGSVLPGLEADRLEARGGIYLRGARVTGMVRLSGARLGGALVCDSAVIEHGDAVALEAEGLEARGGVQLRGAAIRGGVMLRGARLWGNLDAVGASIERQGAVALDGDALEVRGDVALRLTRISDAVSLVGARIGGDADFRGGSFANPGALAVILKRSTVEGAFFWRDGVSVTGALSLNGATLGSIVDEPASWPGPGDLLLNRCRYGGFLGAPVEADARLDWLARQDPTRWDEDFWPQPYEQLSAVLLDMGHEEDARKVLIAKERLQRRARRVRAAPAPWRAAIWCKDVLVGLTVGYGRQPLLAFGWLAAFWVIGTAVFAAVAAHDALRPNIPLFLRAPEWVLCGTLAPEPVYLPSIDQTRPGLAAPGQTQLACLRSQPEAASLTRFNALMYSLDALLPVLETGQQEFWVPDVRTPWGLAGRIYLYVQTIAGWALSLLAVAGFSGLVKSR